MQIELCDTLQGSKYQTWQELLKRNGLFAEKPAQTTVLVWEDDRLIATGSRNDTIIQYLAVDPAFQGMDLTASVLTQLRQDAFMKGIEHLFLYTKPANRYKMQSLFFYPVAQTEQVLLMENRQDGLQEFLSGMKPVCEQGRIGAAVMNCNPFTLGHRYLIETAARECTHLYVFVLSEDKSEFSSEDRMQMVRRGTEDLNNVTVFPTGPYLISSATFPTYFLKDAAAKPRLQCQLDVEIFASAFAAHFHITHRYLGTEPLSELTAQYNRVLKEELPKRGITVCEVERKEADNAPISASKVRALLQEERLDELCRLVPQTTYRYLYEHGYLPGRQEEN